jgi:DNA primase
MPAWLNNVTEIAHKQLTLNPTASALNAKSYLERRGVSDWEILQHRIGYADSLFSFPEASEDFIVWARMYLHDAIVFPIMSLTGEVIGVQIRHLSETNDGRPYRQHYAAPRELHPYAFGLYQSLDSIYERGSVVIVEGIFDYFAIRSRLSTPNCIAIMTSGVSVACRQFFRRFTPTVLALLDMDAPGKEGVTRLHDSADGFKVLSFDYSEKDPAALLEKGKLGELDRLCQRMSNIVG